MMLRILRKDSLWLLALAAVLPVVFVAAALICYLYAKCRILADAMILVTIPLIAGSVFFAGYRTFVAFCEKKYKRAVLSVVVYLACFASACLVVIRLALKGIA